jgi:hypothetical protein
LITCPYDTPKKNKKKILKNDILGIIYHGVPGIGLVEIGFALPFDLSSS